MTTNFEFGSIANPAEAQRLGLILSQCFNTSSSKWEDYTQRLGLENFRVIRQDQNVVGGLVIYNLGQWFGEQVVPMAGIAAVGIATESRGTGVAVEMLAQMLKELHARKVPISTLYPATQHLYRKVGYEQAGSFTLCEIPTATIAIADRTLPVSSVNLNSDIFHHLYRQIAQGNNGNLERNQAIWQRIVYQKSDDLVYAYLIGSATHPEGYIIFDQLSKGEEVQIRIRDWGALTPAAGRRLWTLLGDCRSQIQKVIWSGSLQHPLLLQLLEQTVKIRSQSYWFLRIVDVAIALEKRGYPLGIEAELHLRVEDGLIHENHDHFVLRVTNGVGKVTRGGKGELHLNIRGLSPLYTGLFTPYQLKLAGYLEGTETVLRTAAMLFAGSHPWMPDFF